MNEANLRGADLSGANMNEANLHGANLRDADLSAVNLWKANLRDANLSGAYLSEANLRWANLSRAILRAANLGGVRNLTPKQFDQARNLEGATMPDWVVLRREDNPDGPTYDEWKAQYLAKNTKT